VTGWLGAATVEGNMSTESGLTIRLAEILDLEGVLAVQEENQPENGGSLSARFPRDWFVERVESGSLIVALVAGRVAGYVAFTPPEAQDHVPIVRAMLRAHPYPDAYLHGPICVGRYFRGQGIATAMFRAQRERMSNAPVVAFIREDNALSRNAHMAMGMREVGEFEWDGSDYIVVAMQEPAR
jgi:L-amino acid N-acyltransferase YncA